MDGLECSEVLLSSLERTNRIDSEFYKKKSVLISQLLDEMDAKPITDHVFVSDGNHMSISDKFIYEGIPYYRGQDIHNFFIENARPICIDNQTYNLPYMHRSHLKKGDVLLSIVGTIGKSALVFNDKDATCSCKLAILRPKKLCLSSMIAVYLKTKYGFDQVEKFKRGAVQMGFLIEDMEQILMPDFSDNFATAINYTVNRSHEIIIKENEIYDSAKRSLLDELHIDTSIISAESATKKLLSESFGISGRLDAEYYQPKYDALFERLNTLPTKRLGDIVTTTKSIEPGSMAYREEGIPFIRVSDVTTTGINTPVIKISKKTVPSIETLYPKKDTILFSKDGSVGIAYKVEEDMEAVTSSALLHLNIKNAKEILPDYLTLVLNSNIVKLQAERDTSGAIIQHWKPSDIEKVTIPVLSYEEQRKISYKVQESFALRKRSEKLIESAVRAVEIAIEENEDAAISYLQDNTTI